MGEASSDLNESGLFSLEGLFKEHNFYPFIIDREGQVLWQSERFAATNDTRITSESDFESLVSIRNEAINVASRLSQMNRVLDDLNYRRADWKIAIRAIPSQRYSEYPLLIALIPPDTVSFRRTIKRLVKKLSAFLE